MVKKKEPLKWPIKLLHNLDSKCPILSCWKLELLWHKMKSFCQSICQHFHLSIYSTTLTFLSTYFPVLQEDGTDHVRTPYLPSPTSLLTYGYKKVLMLKRAVEGSGVDGNELFQQSDDPSWCSQRFYTLFCCTNNQMKGYRLYYIKKTTIE